MLCDAYLTVIAAHVDLGERKSGDFSYDVLPHEKAEATACLHDYLRSVMRLVKERQTLKEKTGSVDRYSVWDDITKTA